MDNRDSEGKSDRNNLEGENDKRKRKRDSIHKIK